MRPPRKSWKPRRAARSYKPKRGTSRPREKRIAAVKADWGTGE